MKIKIADTVFEIDNKYSYWEKFVTEYLTDEEPEHYISLDKDFLIKANETSAFPVGYTEFLEVYREICDYIVDKDGTLMHGAVISFDGSAYMFTAPSGTGKTTHIRQWRKLYGKRVGIVNGDKPIIRLIDGKFMVYGTPWCGKEHYNRNTKAPLEGIVLISRGEENVIEQIEPGEINMFLLSQVYFPADAEKRLQVLDFADKLFSTVPLYHLKCNISTDAARVACEKITQKKG